MKKVEAMNILGLNQLTQTLLKQAYRIACSKYHPDRNPAGLEMMKAVNVAYDCLKDLPDDITFTPGTDTGPICYGDVLNEALNAVIDMEGVIIEVCGNWIWLSGNTRPYKEQIKAAGYFWASKKMMWYFRPSDYKRKSRGTFSIDDIRAAHGSAFVSTHTKKS